MKYTLEEIEKYYNRKEVVEGLTQYEYQQLLHIFCERDEYEKVKWLFDCANKRHIPLDVNRDFHYTCVDKKNKIFKFLFKIVVMKNPKDNIVYHAFIIACGNGNSELLEWLYEEVNWDKQFKNKNYGIRITSETECPICYEPKRIVYQLNCKNSETKHLLCSTCILKMMGENDYMNCPYCREKVVLY